MIQTVDKIPLYSFSSLKDLPGLVHFVTTRQGGSGTGEYASFNLGEYCGDRAGVVHRNREILCSALDIPIHSLIVPNQIHENHIRVIDPSFLLLEKVHQREQLQGVDALVTSLSAVCLAVTTADCVPVLCYDPEHKIIASIHAGWRGTVRSIVRDTIREMTIRYGCNSSRIMAVIGPSISAANYEVGVEVVEAFCAAGYLPEQIFKVHPDTRKYHLDLWEVNRLQLIDSGVLPSHIEIAGLCTYASPSLFFSARRQGMKSGRMLTGIMIK